MKNGWVCSYRTMWDHPIFRGDGLRVGVWHWIMHHAAWKPTKFNNGGKIITLDRGQVCISQRQIEVETGMGRQRLRTFLSQLETNQAITQQTTQGRTVITICNYEKYQASSDQENPAKNQLATHEQPTKEQVNNKTKEDSLSAEADATASVSLKKSEKDKAEKRDIAEAVSAYKAMAERQGWPGIRRLSPQRTASLKARLREEGLDGWIDAIRKAAASDHCNGLNDRGWRCNFDFLTSAKSFTKLIEGNYDNPKAGNGAGNNGSGARSGRSSPHAGINAAFAEIAADDARSSQLDLGSNQDAFDASNEKLDLGSGGDASQPLLRLVGP